MSGLVSVFKTTKTTLSWGLLLICRKVNESVLHSILILGCGCHCASKARGDSHERTFTAMIECNTASCQDDKGSKLWIWGAGRRSVWEDFCRGPAVRQKESFSFVFWILVSVALPVQGTNDDDDVLYVVLKTSYNQDTMIMLISRMSCWTHLTNTSHNDDADDFSHDVMKTSYK